MAKQKPVCAFYLKAFLGQLYYKMTYNKSFISVINNTNRFKHETQYIPRMTVVKNKNHPQGLQ